MSKKHKKKKVVVTEHQKEETLVLQGEVVECLPQTKFRVLLETGQEIIARMDSRGKLAKTLVGLRLSDELPIRAMLKAPDGSSGTVTSSVYSPKLGYIGLGLVKPSACSPGTNLSVSINGFSGTASVSKLPF